jgi:hypothetical protein
VRCSRILVPYPLGDCYVIAAMREAAALPEGEVIDVEGEVE